MDKKSLYFILIISLAILLWGFITFQHTLFESPSSTVILDREGHLLNAYITSDGQWRFPEKKDVPIKFEEAILTYEDKYFRYQPGLNPISLIRAVYLNLKHGKIVSGGSTISMQVIRLSRNNPERTIPEKISEIIHAVVLELFYSKDEILALYASHAPFGGNVVGIDAAAWRYFKRPPEQLSLAEIATLAVLPNKPSLIFPGKNDSLLRNKRNTLLNSLFERRLITENELKLSLLENTPTRPNPLPQTAPHLLTRVINDDHKGEIIETTIDINLQKKGNAIVKKYYPTLAANKVYNTALIVTHIRSGEVLAYVGNAPMTSPDDIHNGKDVDIIMAPRSSGSILKPFLYMWAFDQGELLPEMFVEDIPTNFSGYSPENYNKKFSGVIPASVALARSLNVPAVRLLRKFGLYRFYNYLDIMGLSTLHRPADEYGLSLILGGAETTLWDMSGLFRSLALTLYQDIDPKTYKTPFSSAPIRYIRSSLNGEEKKAPAPAIALVNPAAVWETLEAMSRVKRPGQYHYWEKFTSTRKVAWKTGTSFGQRDAWAIGITGDYVVAVWVGNASGEGRPGLIGYESAAPLLFDMINLLPKSDWFQKPDFAMRKAEICSISGHIAGPFCPDKNIKYIPAINKSYPTCPYHISIYVDQYSGERINSTCENFTDAKSVTRFVLPPVQAWYYERENPAYNPLPPYKKDCNLIKTNAQTFTITYPNNGAILHIPKDFGGNYKKIILEAVHSDPLTTLYWHLNDTYLGQTMNEHQMTLNLNPGDYLLTIIDTSGNIDSRTFKVITTR